MRNDTITMQSTQKDFLSWGGEPGKGDKASLKELNIDAKRGLSIPR